MSNRKILAKKGFNQEQSDIILGIYSMLNSNGPTPLYDAISLYKELSDTKISGSVNREDLKTLSSAPMAKTRRDCRRVKSKRFSDSVKPSLN